MAPKQEETQRPFAKFSPSLWGDQFINHECDAQVEEKHSKTVEVLKEEVKGMLTASSTKMVDTMNLIDTLERLGVSYHFKDEIEEKLLLFFNLNTDYNDEAYDLCTVATHFRVFRQHGHRISSDIFGRWMTENGEFEEGLKNDTKGLLSLYEASYLRTHGETILEDALEFTTASLKSLAPHLENPLRKQVERALVQSYHFGFPRIEARIFISFYEEFGDKNESLLRFAKLDYNLLQMLHKKELQELSRWWKDLNLLAKLPYTRDRVVECFFWALGVNHEPQYSRARIMLTKAIAMTSVVDDTFDVYGTIEELDIFTEAIQRWDIEEIKILPEYMKSLYIVLLELYEQFAEELAKEGRSFKVYYAIESLKELTRGYNIEAKWFIQGHLPTFEEYLKNGLISSSCCYLTTSSMIGVESTTKEDFEWLNKKPKMLVALLHIGRLLDDIASYEIEKGRGQIATGIDSYMRDNDVTKEEAMSKFFEIAMDGWKDMNEECLMLPPCSRNVLMQIMNLARVTGVCYKGGEDGYTEPEKVLKPHIMALVVDPISI